MEINKIYKLDCLDGMKHLGENSIDLIIADPPYNLSSGSSIHCEGGSLINGMGGQWNKVKQDWDSFSLGEYFSFTYAWLNESKRVLKESGSMWIFGTYHNIGVINFVCQLLNLEIINEVIWYKSNSFPNLAGRRLTASHETILWVHKSPKKRKYTFNYDLSKNGNFDYDTLKTRGKQMRTVWSIPNNKHKWELKFGKHPTQKPVRVIDRLIQLSSNEGDLVLSPFCGSGTECISAKKNNRNFISFEINQEYIDLANNRLNDKDIKKYE